MKARISWIAKNELERKIREAKTLEELKELLIEVLNAVPEYDPYS